MTHIKKNHSHTDGHHHFVTRQKNGHKFTSLFCDSKTHLHSGKPIRTKNGVREILYAKDGVKVVEPKPHANHQGHSHKISGKKDVAHKAENHVPASRPKLKRKKISRQGEAGHIINKARRRAASKETAKPAATTEAPSTENANTVNQNTNTPPQATSNLAQFLAANPNLKFKLLPVDKDGAPSSDTTSGVAIIKQHDGKCVVMGENSSATFDLETTDPEKPTAKDLEMIAARLKSNDPAQKLYIGKFVEAQAPAPQEPSTNAPATPNATPAVAPTGDGAVQEQPLAPIKSETKISPNGDAPQTVPVTPTDPVVPAQELPISGVTPPAK
jgi:hypothetical protein